MLDEALARAALVSFQEMAHLKPRAPGSLYDGTVEPDQEKILSQAHLVDLILDRLTPDWRGIDPYTHADQWSQRREASVRALTALDRGAEIEKILGDDAPRISASHLHPWVWEGAKSRWASGQRGDAVLAAAIQLNAETQKKIGRTDVSETDLFKQAISMEPPELGKPRLRLGEDDGSKTYVSRQRGAMAFAEGCYTGIRNPRSHQPHSEMSEDEALEQLAALSVLARWVDQASVEESRAPRPTPRRQRNPSGEG